MIIGLIGYIGEGKSTVAQILEERYGFSRRSFADALREEVADVLAVSGGAADRRAILDEMRDAQAKKRYRLMLQWWGTEWRRGQDPDYWVKQMAHYLDDTRPPVVIDDVRFPNEAQMLRDRGAILVRVRRPAVDEEMQVKRPVMLHESEQFVPQLPAVHVIPNDGTLDDLRLQVRRLMERLY